MQTPSGRRDPRRSRIGCCNRGKLARRCRHSWAACPLLSGVGTGAPRRGINLVWHCEAAAALAMVLDGGSVGRNVHLLLLRQGLREKQVQWQGEIGIGDERAWRRAGSRAQMTTFTKPNPDFSEPCGRADSLRGAMASVSTRILRACALHAGGWMADNGPGGGLVSPTTVHARLRGGRGLTGHCRVC